MNEVVTTKTVALEDLIAKEVNPTGPDKTYQSNTVASREKNYNTRKSSGEDLVWGNTARTKVS